MKKLSAFFSLASAVFAVVPGVAVLLSNVGVPPNASKNLFAATIEALGVITLMILWVNKEWIKQRSLATITKMSVFSIIIFIVSLFSYIFLYGYLVVEVPESEPLFFPLWAEGELKTNLAKLGSRGELVNQWGRDDVYKVIQNTSTTQLLITTLILLFIYQLLFVSLTLSFGLLGIKSNSLEPES